MSLVWKIDVAPVVIIQMGGSIVKQPTQLVLSAHYTFLGQCHLCWSFMRPQFPFTQQLHTWLLANISHSHSPRAFNMSARNKGFTKPHGKHKHASSFRLFSCQRPSSQSRCAKIDKNASPSITRSVFIAFLTKIACDRVVCDNLSPRFIAFDSFAEIK